jgi:large subunit ribosomal protein L22
MSSSAVLRGFGVPPRKVRYVADMVRGKPVEEALRILAFVPRAGALPLAKLIRSAVANAQETASADPDRLFVKSVLVDAGPTAKRFRPRSQGRAFRILKRSSQITVELGEKK